MMAKMSFMDKINVLIETSKSSKIFILIIVAIAFLALILFTTNNKNKKTGQKIFLSIYAFITLFLLVAFHDSLGKMFEYMMNNFFIVLYFPNLAIYLAAIIVTNIILWVSVFNNKTARIIKNINIIVYLILNYILSLILHLIHTKKLDIFTQESIYGHNDTHALIELSSVVFTIWIIFLVLYKIILKYLKRNEKEKIRVKRVVVEKKKLPENFIATTPPTTVIQKQKTTLKQVIEEVKEISKDKKEEIEILDEPFEEFFSKLKAETEDIKQPPIQEELSIESLFESISEEKEIDKNQIETQDIIPNSEIIKPTTALEEIIFGIGNNKPNYDQITLSIEPEIIESKDIEEPKIVEEQIVENPIIKEEVKEIPKEKNIIFNEVLDNLLTLEDYKSISKMLKEYKAKEEIKKEQENEELKLQELNNLYRSISR